TSLDPSWSELELHLSGDKFLRCDLNEWGVWLFIGLETLVGQVFLVAKVFGYKEVTRRCLEALDLKGGDGGACKLLSDVIEVLGCLLEVLGCLKWVKMKENRRRVHFILG
ncbi:hypothetical protein Tco_1551376, partial [Tanacetum coccineum]